MNKFWPILFLSWLALLSACSEVSEYIVGDEEIAPSELIVFKQTLAVKLEWSTQLNAMSERLETRMDPIEVDGAIYIAEPEGRVVAHDAATGKLLWEIFLDMPVSGGLGAGDSTVDNNALFLGTDDARVIALDLKTGNKKWIANVSSEVLVPPKIKGNTVIAYSADGVIAAINATSGERLWSSRNAVPSLSLRGTSEPLISTNVVIVGLANGKLIALDINNGKKLWETAIAVARGRSELERIVDIDSAVRIKNGIIYVASYQGRFAAVNASNGRIIWVRDLSSYQDIELGDTQIYLTDNQSQVWALDSQSGATMWRQEKLKGRLLTAPVVQKEFIVIGDFQGYVHWLSREDGRLVARQDLDRANTSATVAGTIHTLEEYEVGDDFDFKDISGIISRPVVVGDMLYIADKGGVLAAYRIGNGT